jgi:AGZA family xanthine/uracil permease-like MFS transporter
MKCIPRSVKLATIVGMGMQIALVGMTSVKLVVPNKDTIVGLGDITNYQIWLSFGGLIIIGTLLYHQVEGGILIGIFIMTFATWFMEKSYPTNFIEFPDLTMHPTNFIDLTNYDPFKCIAGIAAFLFIGLIDVSGVIFGMASLAGITKEDGSIPGSAATFIAVSISSLFSAVTGGTPIIVYVESATGIKEGGRTGLTAVFIGIFFLLSIFLAPVLGSIPLTATSPIAILIGAMMMSQAEEIDWENMSDAIPAFLTLSIIPLTFSITNGILFGLLAAFFFYITTGQFWIDLRSYFSGNSSPAISARTEFDGLESELTRIMPKDQSPRHLHQELVRRDSNSFMDNEPFVRTPSLILAKSEAEAIRKGRGLSADHDHHHHGHNPSHDYANPRQVGHNQSQYNYI